MGAKIISEALTLLAFLLVSDKILHALVFSLVSSVAMVHAVRSAMQSLKKTGTDFSSARGMDPKAFFEVMGKYEFFPSSRNIGLMLSASGLNEVIELDAKAGGSAFAVV